MNHRHGIARLLPLSALLLSAGCQRPTGDPATLAAVRIEAQDLKKAYPIGARQVRDVAPSHWPPAIAGLHPKQVTIYATGVDILTQSGFDGGWGYHVTRDARDLPMPAACYEAIAHDVFWHGPC